MTIKRFYRDSDDLEGFCFQLKQFQCPHCHCCGFLILHGFLYGYSETSTHDRIIRGRRFFCNNRGRQRGCGRTFSLLDSSFMRKFIILAGSFWAFLQAISCGRTKKQAFRDLHLSFSDTSIYRWYTAFSRRLSFLRTYITRILSDIQPADHRPPDLQTISCLNKAFSQDRNPISCFQDRFQVSFL